MLASGLLTDLCPLCGSERAEDEKQEALSSTASSGNGGGESLQSEDMCEGLTRTSRDNSVCEIGESVRTNPKEGKAISAPPGIGPPGIWFWPADADPPGGKTAPDDRTPDGAGSDTPGEEHTFSWPESYSNSPAVEFVCHVAQYCFEASFMSMNVSFAQPDEEGQTTANLELHLRQAAMVSSMPPMARLQAVLARDHRMHQFHIFSMDRSIDNSSLRLSCAQVSADTCWDALKPAGCWRGSSCPWEHPVPTVVHVQCAGDHAALPTPLATLMPKVPFDPTTSDVIMNKGRIPATTVEVNMVELNHQQLNIHAYDDDYESDDS